MTICRECTWETEMRKFHGASIRVLAGHGHSACVLDACECQHEGPRPPELPGVAQYVELFQEAVDDQ